MKTTSTNMHGNDSTNIHGEDGVSEQKRVVLIDDHPIVRQGLSQLIQQETDLSVCGEAIDEQTALEVLATTAPDIVVLDLSLHGGSGISLIKKIKLRYPELPILVLSMHDETLYAERVLRTGAKGYIMKHEKPDKVIDAINCILGGDIYLSEKMSSTLVHKFIDGAKHSGRAEVGYLSDRELEVFQLIGCGLATRQIAEKLYISVKTIESHRARIKEKLKLKTATELVQYAIKWVQSEKA